MVEGRYKPTKVTASATTGIATSMGCDPKTEDTITLLVDWQNLSDPNQRGTAVYTASWAAPLKAGVHSEQRFHYMAAKGEVRVDQAHRGYSVVEDDVGKLDVSLFFNFPFFAFFFLGRFADGTVQPLLREILTRRGRILRWGQRLWLPIPREIHRCRSTGHWGKEKSGRLRG